MSKTTPIPSTNATRFLKDNGVLFTPHPYKYEERGGTAVSSRELGVDEYQVIKTLIMETDAKLPLIVLMHGNLQVSTKELARCMNVKTVRPCSPENADRHSGYQIGGTSPFGTRKKMPVFVQKTILELDLIYINGGQKGFLVSLVPSELQRVLAAIVVDVATGERT
jgi:Cys-tRNA(Pro) deacylase